MPTSAAAATALLVVCSTMLNASDTALKQRLDRYYTTTVRDDGAAADTSKDVVVLSGSAAASTLGSKYGTKANRVVVLAPAVLPDMAMADAFGTVTGETQIKVVKGSSTLAAGSAIGRWSRSTRVAGASAGSPRPRPRSSWLWSPPGPATGSPSFAILRVAR